MKRKEKSKGEKMRTKQRIHALKTGRINAPMGWHGKAIDPSGIMAMFDPGSSGFVRRVMAMQRIEEKKAELELQRELGRQIGNPEFRAQAR